MKSEIINVGTELLLGNILNKNSKILSEELSQIGIDVFFHTTVGDNEERLKSAVNISLQRSDVIILTGGLGPTTDDITKEVVAKVLDKKLVLDNQLLHKIHAFFNKKKMKMTSNNVKQALIIKGSTVLHNDIGTAPGFFIKHKGKLIILLPGPPSELKHMTKKYLINKLQMKSNAVIKSKTIKTIGIGESQLESKIEKLTTSYSNPTIAIYAEFGQVKIRITAKSSTIEECNDLIMQAENKIRPYIKEYIYSYNNESIEEVILKLLIKNNMKIGFCESCTGGLISSRFTKIPGVSQVFERGLVTYSNNSKTDLLGVKKDTISKHGAVSKETAFQMAKGLYNNSKINIALSVTGIAGPSGNTKDKPIGLVYIGLVADNFQKVNKYELSGSREIIQMKTANLAFDSIRKFLIQI